MHTYDYDAMASDLSRKQRAILRKQSRQWRDNARPTPERLTAIWQGADAPETTDAQSVAISTRRAFESRYRRESLDRSLDDGLRESHRISTVKCRGVCTCGKCKTLPSPRAGIGMSRFMRDMAAVGRQATLPQRDRSLLRRDKVARAFIAGNRLPGVMREVRGMVKVIKGKGSAR